MPKKKNSQNNSKLIILGALILVLVGIVTYALVQNYSSSQPDNISPQQPATSGDDAKREADIILSKVKMNMTKDEVVEAVGQPHSCSTKTSTENGKTYVMEQCSYGKKNASGHALITFLNGKVWGTTYEAGAIHTDTATE